MNRLNKLAVVGFAMLLGPVPMLAETRYAGPAATGDGQCGDWDNLCTLTEAITDHAVSGDEIWVKAGTYGPITLKTGVKIYGGFAGGEAAAAQSDPEANITIIDAGGTPGARAVLSQGNDSATVLRGFRITGGYDTSEFWDIEGGGGVLVENSSALFIDCVLDNNSAKSFGGAVSIRGTGSPQFVNCIFHDNGVDDSDQDPNNHLFVTAGGAVYTAEASPTFTNCLFYANTALEAAAVAVDSGVPTFHNCTFADNTATIGYGGGLYDPTGVVTVKNCIFWGNTAIRGHDQLGAHPGKTITVSHSAIQGGYTGTNNITSDPLFAGGSDGYRLQATSPCREAGDTAARPLDVADLNWNLDCGEKLPLDLDLVSRVISTEVDIGAYEYRDCATDTDCSGGMVCCSGVCQDCCDDGDCGDGLFCNGVETCGGEGTCIAGSYPCATGQSCTESTNMCGCTVDADCDDGFFCAGIEICVNNSCEDGGDPCPGQFCDPFTETCVACIQDSDCHVDKQCCSGHCQECCNNQDCPGMFNLCCPAQGFVCSTTCPFD